MAREAVAEEMRVYKHQVEERAGSARGDPSDLGQHRAGRHRALPRCRSVQALFADLEARGRLPDGARRVFDTVAVDMLAGADGPQRHVLRANGSTLVKPGYIAVYQEGRDDAEPTTTAITCCRRCRPAMPCSCCDVQPQQHFTEPPPRFTEASLVKALEEYGIGRPSTYASIISTLRDREYVEIENRRFTATDIGKIVNRFLTEHFHQYVDYGFTAAMEDELDAVSRGEEAWTTPLSKFWKPFIQQVEDVEKNVTREQVAQARELGTRSGQRQADERAHGPLRPVRADRHQG